MSLAENNNNPSFIESRIFLVTLVFTFISGLRSGFQPFLVFILQDLGYRMLEMGLALSIIGLLFSLINPVLFYITLFFTCPRELLTRIAGTILSLIVGSLIGHWAGGVVGAYYVCFNVNAESFAGIMYNLAYQTPSSIISTTLAGFAIVASAWVTTKWNEALEGLEVPSEKPSGIVVASILYVICGFLTFCVAPLPMIVDPLRTFLFKNLFITYGLISLILVGGALQLIIAYGLYVGKRWGWVLAFVSALSGVVISVNHFALHEKIGLFQTMFGAVTLALNVVVLIILLKFNVRLYCRFVDPSDIQKGEKHSSSINKY
jgi:hypothetical protein